VPPPSPQLLTRLNALIEAGWEFDAHFDSTVRDHDFHPFIAADYDVLRDALLLYRQPGARFLEWGSGSGIITIMAEMVGFSAYGIELDASLVRTSKSLAARFDSSAQFVAGSYLPTGYHWRPALGARDTEKTGDGPSGYLQLGLALDDFDVVYGYPWNGEAPMMLDLMQRYGRSDALLLLNDTIDGVRAYRGGKLVKAEA
jgi:hypothetical protein